MARRVSVFTVMLLAALALIVSGCETQKAKAPAAKAPAAPAAQIAPVAPAKAPAAPMAPAKAPAAMQTPAPATAAGELKVVNTFKIGGEGRWDLLAVDARNHRVYIARSTRVEVIDSENGTVVGEIADVNGAHGVALVGQINRGFATAGRDNAIVVFDMETLKTVKTIKAGTNPDAITYDNASKKIYCFNGRSNDATVVDTTDLEKEPTTIALGGKPEIGVADGRGHVYVNIEDKSEVVAIESTGQTITARWPLAPGEEPSGLALDRAKGRLFAGCSNQMMIVLDIATGKVVSSVPVGQGVDGAAFDRTLGAVCPNGRDATLTVVRETADGKYAAVQTVPTAKGARTIAADGRNHLFYLPCTVPGEGGQDTFALVVVGAAK